MVQCNFGAEMYNNTTDEGEWERVGIWIGAQSDWIARFGCDIPAGQKR